jgi:hypothetical protein
MIKKNMRGCCTWGGFFLVFFLLFVWKKNAKQHMQNNQNDKKPTLESEVGDPKPAGVVRCVARMGCSYINKYLCDVRT